MLGIGLMCQYRVEHGVIALYAIDEDCIRHLM